MSLGGRHRTIEEWNEQHGTPEPFTMPPLPSLPGLMRQAATQESVAVPASPTPAIVNLDELD